MGNSEMILAGFLLAAAAAPRIDMHKVPVVPNVVASPEMRVPIGRSVRAATWDELNAKPTQPVRVRLACIVMVEFGAPGDCVPADLIPPKQAAIDWAKLIDADRAARAADTSAEGELRRIAMRRIATARVKPQKKKDMFAIRFFDEAVGPADMRAPFAPGGTPFTLNDLVSVRPLDMNLVDTLYPPEALRNGVTARVRVTCRIEADFKLLCRDPGAIQMSPTAPEARIPTLRDDFRLAAYQFTSIVQVQPEAKDGQPVAGRDVTIGIVWMLP